MGMPPMPLESSVESRHQRYWEEFYGTSADRVPVEPSPFARWVAKREATPGPLVDVGTGTGRDALWFARKGFTVFGCDYSQHGVEYASAHAREAGLSAQFSQVDVYDVERMTSYARDLCVDAHPTAVYARFFVHALEDDGRRNLWTLSSEILGHHSGRVYLEFRTKPTKHEFGEHYRKFVAPATVEAELVDHGFQIESSEERHGLAVHKNEDPLVARIVARCRT
jgi:Methyltransferase domain